MAVQARDNNGVSQYSNVVLVGDDGTILKQIIIFGRHSIRSATYTPSSLAKFAIDPYPDFVGVQQGYLTPRGQQAARLLAPISMTICSMKGFSRATLKQIYLARISAPTPFNVPILPLPNSGKG